MFNFFWFFGSDPNVGMRKNALVAAGSLRRWFAGQLPCDRGCRANLCSCFALLEVAFRSWPHEWFGATVQKEILGGGFPERLTDFAVRGQRSLQYLIQPEFLIESRKKIGKPGLNILLGNFFRMNEFFPGKGRTFSAGTGNEAVPPTRKNTFCGGEHQNDSAVPNRKLQTVFGPFSFKGHAQNVFLRRQKFHHLQNVIPCRAVDFRDESSDAFRDLAFLNFMPVRTPCKILFSLTH